MQLNVKSITRHFKRHSRADLVLMSRPAGIMVALAILPQIAMASTLNIPGLSALCTLQDTFSGPVLGSVAVVMIILGGIAIGAGESSFMKFCGGTMAGIALAGSAVSLAQAIGVVTSC